MKLSGKQVAAARELLGLSQTDLAKVAGVAPRTITRFETGEAPLKPVTLSTIQSELERRGIEFTNGDHPPSTDPGIGVRLNLVKAAAFARREGEARKEAEP